MGEPNPTPMGDPNQHPPESPVPPVRPQTCECPFSSTSSANRTLTGFVFSLALFSAVRNDDLGPP